MQHDYFPVRLGDMGSRTKYVGLSEDTRKGFWINNDDDAPTSIKVTSKYLNHSVLTLGYKLEEFARIPQSGEDASLDDHARAARGVSVAYITDHEPFDHSLAKGGFVEASINAEPPNVSADLSHTQFFKNVDVLFHDAQYFFSEYSPESATSKEYWGHSTVEYVVEVAFFANVKQLLLFHHDPQRNDDQMDALVEFARNKAMELEKQYGDSMPFEGEERVPMKVNAAREGDVYELDPFVFADEGAQAHDADEVDSDVSSVETSIASSQKFLPSHSDRQTVLLGLYQTEAAPITDALKSENNFDVKVLQNCHDVLQFAQERHPSVIVLDEDLFGGGGFEVCEEVRSNMGKWGEHVSLLVIASPKGGSDEDSASGPAESKEQAMADRLNVEDYIRGPFSPSYLLTRIQVSLLRMPLRWRRAPFSSKEPQRLQALQSTGLLDSIPEERFDRITRLCSTMFNVPISLVSLVDKDRQWFKSNTGLPGATETPRDHAFCAHAILEDGVMVVPDALQDARFADNPLVEGAPNVRFYAGCPIRVSSNGSSEKLPIGTLCVIDSKPRDLGEDQLRALRDFGAMVEREISGTD